VFVVVAATSHDVRAEDECAYVRSETGEHHTTPAVRITYIVYTRSGHLSLFRLDQKSVETAVPVDLWEGQEDGKGII
jgi:hypothetical protein